VQLAVILCCQDYAPERQTTQWLCCNLVKERYKYCPTFLQVSRSLLVHARSGGSARVGLLNLQTILVEAATRKCITSSMMSAVV
jgi:hypothetical protein